MYYKQVTLLLLNTYNEHTEIYTATKLVYMQSPHKHNPSLLLYSKTYGDELQGLLSLRTIYDIFGLRYSFS